MNDKSLCVKCLKELEHALYYIGTERAFFHCCINPDCPNYALFALGTASIKTPDELKKELKAKNENTG